MEKKWRKAAVDPAERDRLAREIDGSRILAALLLGRGISSAGAAARFLDPRLLDLHDPFLLPDMDRAAARIEEALRRDEPIAVCGDYDADGLSATALLVDFFRLLGRSVRVRIPHRIEDGYGLNAGTVRSLASEGVRVIVTVDNGSSALEEIDLAAGLGIDVVVTDHHQVPSTPPAACALVNPWARESAYPDPHLAGAGVAFKLAWAISQRLSRGKKLSQEFRAFLLEALSLTALGTISDVVPLVGENRILAKHGLLALRRTRRAGLRCLVESALRGNGGALESEHVAFRIGPSINAAGRLGDAELALRLLLSESEEEARELTAALERENRRRQKIEEEIHDAALLRVRAEIDFSADRAIVLADPLWHPGVIGIVASRLCEEFCRPTILIALQGDRGRGSVRSIAGVHICQALEKCREHLIAFGGHARAAGMEVAPDRIPELRRALNHAIPLAPEEMVPEVVVDAEVKLRELTVPTIREMGKLAPFGNGNRRPLLAARDLVVAGSPRIMGQQGQHLSFLVRDGDDAGPPRAVRAVAFGRGEAARELSRQGLRIDLAFDAALDTWGGEEKVQLNVKEIRQAGPELPCVPACPEHAEA